MTSALSAENNMPDSYEIQQNQKLNKTKCVSFKKMLLLTKERCAKETKPCCCQTAANCKTHEGKIMLVKLKIVEGHISFAGIQEKVKGFAVGKYCKCDI